MTIRDYTRRLMRYFVLPQPTRERNLRIYLPPRVVPSAGLQCGCHMIAKRYWRTAHENHCTRILVHAEPVHVHSFDTVDLMRAHVRELGWWPVRPELFNGTVPVLRATRTAQAAGDTFETRRWDALVPVGAPPVSGDPGGPGE